jgi:hypothetical protein
MWDKRAHQANSTLRVAQFFFSSYSSIWKEEEEEENETRKTHQFILSAESNSTCLFSAIGIEKK